MDANTVASIATCVIAVMAIAAAIIAIWQARLTARVQILLQLDSSWMSAAMQETRRKAAESLLKGERTANVDRILDFFETIAGIFVKRHVLCSILPDAWARHTFYWSAVCYWCKNRDYIETVRRRESERDTWNNLCDLMPRWITKEGCAPTEKDIDDFLDDERST